MTRLLTYSKENQATFDCPIFNVETKVSTCLSLRDKHWRGERISVRAGCRACMSSSKCPISVAVQSISFSKKNAEELDIYGSKEPRKIRLDDELLQKILPVIVQAKTIYDFQLSEQEIELIGTANARIEAQMRTAPTAKSAASSNRRADSKSPRKVTPPTPTPSAPISTINQAAATGDMGAAINAASGA